MNLTIRDIAKRAGVSVSTVSRVINNSKPVNKEVKEKVLSIINETGYRPNALARGLINKSTHLIGVIIPQITANFAHMVEGIEAVAREYGYHIILTHTNSDVEKEMQAFDIFREKQLDGIILSGVELTDRHYQKFDQVGIPTVIVGQMPEQGDIPNVDVDNYNASHEMVRYLIRCGHQNIAMIHGPLRDKTAGALRLEAFKDALKENDVPLDDRNIVESDFTSESGYLAMEKILSLKDLPTAVFAAADSIAIGAMNCAIDQGFRVPEDISIAGFDDIPMATSIRPKLTTVHVSSRDMGFKAMDLLIKKIKGEAIEQLNHQVDYRLTIRDSTQKRN